MGRHFITKHFVFLGLLLVVLVELGLFFLSSRQLLKFGPEITIQTYTVIPLFILAILQLAYNGRLQKTDFLRNYSEEFFTNEALYSAFHQLVYTYRDSDFEKVEALITEHEAAKTLSDKTPRPVFTSIQRSLGVEEIGCRLYHPKYFQGSPEERRLDMLIGYFDLLGYHHMRGYLSIEDIAGSLGHYLNMLSRRKVIQSLRAIYRDAVLDSDYAKHNGRIRPFYYFEELMRSIENFNSRIEKQC
jgi:hypothetical protein